MNKFAPTFALNCVFSAAMVAPETRKPLSRLARFGQILLDAFEWLARSGVVLPIGAASAVSVVALAASEQVSLPLAAAAFLLVYASYLIDHLADVGRFEDGQASERSLSLARRKQLFSALGVAAFAGAGAMTAIKADPVATLLLFSFPLAVVLYGTPWFGVLTRGAFRYRRLKDIPGIKAFYTAFFWGLLMVYADRFIDGHQPSLTLFFSGYMFLSMFVNTVYCDFKDLERDRLESVATLPLMFGVSNTLRLLKLVNVTALVWLITFAAAGWIPVWTTGLASVHGYVSGVLHHGAKLMGTGGLPGDAAIDAEFALWLPCALLGLGVMSSFG
ncbi:hypothetical protein [Methylocaldum sp.]|uniref:hypothetical protein n=1 Tax=Methylocaldum sp. TaxID=1969727 RepID=UPI002D5FCD63|nr:hypothetical protein [Methylocaldum sp.]HYE38073.1 hypothetical protein [Methylocaldum sp.]